MGITDFVQYITVVTHPKLLVSVQTIETNVFVLDGTETQLVSFLVSVLSI